MGNAFDAIANTGLSGAEMREVIELETKLQSIILSVALITVCLAVCIVVTIMVVELRDFWALICGCR